MGLLNIAVFLIALVPSSLCYKLERNQGTNEKDPVIEYLRLDPTAHHELVSLEITELRKQQEEDESLPAGKRVHIRAFGSDVDLWLHPKDSILVTENTPIYVSRYSEYLPGNADIVEWPGIMKSLGQIYEDADRLASFVICTDSYGRTTVNGRIESMNLVVRSLPERVVSEYVEQRRPANASTHQFPDATYHVVYRTSGILEKAYPMTGLNARRVEKRTNERPGVPKVIYPKILLVIDHSMYKLYKNDVNELLEYILTLANGIDLKYRSLESPSFRFHIAGILLAVEPEALPYISTVKLGEGAFNSTIAMKTARSFFYSIRESIPLATYDIALTLTRLKFGSPDNGDNVLGKAWVGVTCKDTEGNKALDAVAICLDDGTFSGIHVAAHELGHTFGLWHDAQQSDECSFRNGFLMAFTPYYTKNSSTFSNCSLNDFQRKIEYVLSSRVELGFGSMILSLPRPGVAMFFIRD
ncbi:venom metalloproteinase 2-like [Venturia canescens]|uniref:venom metalloproteinase 2-like n=1 Tax=Venturia canescens TaxID=32260 RepID=UPI001C9CF6FB|nr:venom metalloproteinase 2-like [Venturia canescens]